MLQVYYCKLTDGEAATDLACFSRYRLDKLDKITHPVLRKQMCAAEQLLIDVIRERIGASALPPIIETMPGGKPYLANIPLFFSLSHSGSFVACAVADYEIGLDIQETRPGPSALMRRCFSEEEREYVRASSDPAAAFTGLWCLKESYVKATGEGLRRELGTVSFSLSPGIVMQEDPDARFWTFAQPGFHMAVCALSRKKAQPDQIVKRELRSA